MKAATAWTASLVLIGAWVSACGEQPTPENQQRFSTARHALTCSEDTQAPELSITDQTISYECTGAATGNAWVAPEVTAVDDCDGPVPVHKYNTGDDDGDGVPGSIDPDDFGPGPTTETVGQYYVQYLAWDTSYNIQGAMLLVNVQDTLKPVLTLNGDEYIQTQCFNPTDDPTDPDTDVEVDPDPYLEQGATAQDQCYGDLSSQVQTLGEINKQSPGVYTVEYHVQDGALHPADPITRAVEVIDNIAPKVKPSQSISLSQPSGTMQQVDLSQCGVAWDLCDGYMDILEAGNILTITSNDPGNDTSDIQLLGNSAFAVRVRHNANGSARVYTVQYVVSDHSANETTATCTVYAP